MSNIVAKIVLTGGPCAGKTSALAKIEEHFTDLGYKVLIVSESATELIKGGTTPSRDLSMEQFQEIILQYQMMKEQTYDKIAYNLNTDKCIIIYDRGLMDNSAYISDIAFTTILENLNLSKLDLLDRYDLVIHLVTAASGAKEFYTLSNNTSRSETIEEAIMLDQKNMNAWKGHRNFCIIDNSTTFSSKLNKVIEQIENLIGKERIHKQHKYLVASSSINPKFLEKAIKIDIEQVYLESTSYERRLRKRSLNGDTTYYYTAQKYDSSGTSKVLVDKKISQKTYDQLLSDNAYHKISKTRYSFINEKQFFKLDIFEDETAILEIDSDTYSLPPELNILADVTDNPDFYNNALAKTGKSKIKKRP